MKTVEIKVPSTMSNEGIKVKKWYIRDNENVKINSLLVEIESGDFYLEMNSDYAGKVKIFLKEGEIGKTNDILCTITY
ncbi:Biotin-requiring enzyme [Chryseobacterium soldanellicola]|uniref:Biotin-requiring enzyme n=1 Tax=Chryseobacterium soldanellicola TaxID=311333 RepID=A0A1H1AFM3_9FLAO|nr:biotin/lipoyl-containing protein [Chryseobacterium soldanellicola]SDQ38535.1 Biotin-requiring enzyme [Chryseobacterium soldanellicola]